MAPGKRKYVVYLRVSTQKQGRSGLGLEAQQASVEAFLRAHNGQALVTFKEIESGKVNERPELQKAILRCKQTKATLLVAKLDRLSRNAAFLLTLKDSDVNFACADMPEMNHMVVGVMALVAQQEREAISARTKAALQARKARGQVLGFHTHLPENQKTVAPESAAIGNQNSAKVRGLKADERAQNIMYMVEEARATGCKTLQCIADYLNDQGATTPRGKTWTPAAVRLAILRTTKVNENA